MKNEHLILGTLIALILCSLLIPFCTVLLGTVRITWLRLKGILTLTRAREASIAEFYSALKLCLKSVSPIGCLKLMFYNPRCGALVLLLLLLILFITCAAIGVSGTALSNVLSEMWKT